MRRAWRWMRWVLLTLALPALALGGLFAVTFGSDAPLPERTTLSPSVEMVKAGFVGMGLIALGDGRVALVDAGNDDRGEALLRALKDRGLGPEAVAALFLTHGHGDHLAACKLLPKAEVHALAAEVELIEGRTSSKGPIAKVMPKKDYGCRVSHPHQDGDRVTLGNATVEVLALPGHTRGSAAYLVDGVLFLGDSADAGKDGTLHGAKWVFSDSQLENRASLKALADRLAPRAAEIKKLAPAHSGSLPGLGPLAAFTP